MAYLTTAIGPNATPATELATTSLVFPSTIGQSLTLFSNLSLGPGTYYIVIYSNSMIGGGWLFGNYPTDVTSPGTSIGLSNFSYDSGLSVAGPALYSPDLPFFQTQPGENFLFEVSGDPLAATPAPEPASAYPALLALLMALLALLGRRKLFEGTAV